MNTINHLTFNVLAQPISDVAMSEDAEVPGTYQVTLDGKYSNKPAGDLAGMVLDSFHNSVAISELDNFNFHVLNRDNLPVHEDKDYESYSFEGNADVEKISNETYLQCLDWGLSAEELDCKYNPDGEGEHPEFMRKDWRDEVVHENTISGYWDWVTSQLSAAQHDALIESN